MSAPVTVPGQFSIFDWASTPLRAIVWRELLTTLRQRRYGGLLFAMALFQISVALPTPFLIAEHSLAAAEAISSVITVQCVTLLLVLFLVVPALAAVTLAAERQQQTDDLLRTALFHPATVVAGKLIAVLAVFMLFQLALLPFGAFIYFFAGIEPRSLFQAAVLLYSTALAHALIGITLSHVMRSPSRTVFAAYTCVSLLYAVPFARYRWEMRYSTATLRLPPPPDPVTLLAKITASEAGWWECARLAFNQFGGALLVVLLCAAIALGNRLWQQGWERRKSTRHNPARARGPIPDWGNPFFHREYRNAALARPFRATILFIVFAVGAALFNAWSVQELRWRWDAFDAGSALLYVMIPLLVVERCAREMDPDTLLHLRITNLDPERMLTGMGLAMFATLVPAMLGLIAGATIPVVVQGYEAFTQHLAQAPRPEIQIYKAALVGPKIAFAMAICFMCVRYRSPSTTDIAVTLTLSYVFIILGELVVQGLVRANLVPDLDHTGILVVTLGHMTIALLCAAVPAGIAQVRFIEIFELGPELFDFDGVDRRYR